MLYVRHDIYRIMIVTFGYLFLFSLLQLSVTYRPLLIFLLTGYFFLKTIQSFSNDSSEIKNEKEPKQLPKIKRYRQFASSRRKFFYFCEDFKSSLKDYFNKIRKNHAFLYFLSLLIIMIGL